MLILWKTRAPAVLFTEMHTRAGLKKSAMCRALDKLEKRNWIERKRSRSFIHSTSVSLTPAGRTFVRSLEAA